MFASSPAFSSFAVDDTAKARSFYADTLGLQVEDLGMGGLLGLRLAGGGQVMVYPKPDFAPSTYTVLSFPVADLDQAVDDLVAAGVTMERYDRFDQDDRGIARDSGGPAIAWFRDPAGNILAVLDETGMAGGTDQ
jgi:catechol 2,3-dioxygenase-like lactoylglutathione lyase family enzyme